jgi:hypothetical protein
MDITRLITGILQHVDTQFLTGLVLSGNAIGLRLIPIKIHMLVNHFMCIYVVLSV